MKVAITGASGWLGRASIHQLVNNFCVQKDSIYCFGSSDKYIKVDGTEFKVHSMKSIVDLGEVDLFIHLAFKTRDYVATVPLTEYVNVNRYLTDKAVEYVQRTCPRSVITISSGAVFDSPRFSSLAKDISSNPYGVLKIEEENRLSEITEECGSTLIINRLWGLSGRDVQNPRPFALYDFIEKALSNSTISIRSGHRVRRRYVDARELVSLCIALSLRGDSMLFNSGGPFVEIGELAGIVIKTLNSDSEITREDPSGALDDNYFAKDYDYERLLMEVSGSHPMPITNQILESSQYFGQREED